MRFDKLWQNELTAKTKDKTFSRTTTRITQDYLTGRIIRIRRGEATSTERRITAEVPQGSTMSLALYITFTSVIPTGPKYTRKQIYANDVAKTVT